MKQIKYIIVIAFLALALNNNSYGQGTFTNLTYDMSIPLGNTADFIGKTSFRGFSFDIGRFVTDNLALDLRFSWHTFYEELPYDSYYDGTQTVTGKQFRYINSFPITGGVKYFFNSGSQFMPYIGAGLGAYGQYIRTDMGIYTVENRQWHFGFFPEAGFVYEFSYGTGLVLNARYDNTLAAGGNDGNSYLTFSVGFHFRH